MVYGEKIGMNDISRQIIEYIDEKKMSTEEVSDAMGKIGVVNGAKPIAKGQFAVGLVQYVYTYLDSNWAIHEQIRDLRKDVIVFVDDINVTDKALFGQLVSRFIIQKKNAKAIVTKGWMRDVQGMIEDGTMVWCKDITPIGCFNKKEEITPEIEQVMKKNREYYDGSIAVCDDSGVVIIPKELITEEFLEKLKFLHNQESVWFDCVMNKNWDTYDTVCLKKYKDESSK